MNKKQWYYSAVTAVLLSIITLFLPIVSYTPKGSPVIVNYNIIGIMGGSQFTYQVLNDYHGTVFTAFSIESAKGLTVLICLIGICAIAASFLGLKSMVKQYSSAKPFRLTIAGLIGTALPALTLLILHSLSKTNFPGKLTLGLYVYTTPLAMLLACITVTRRYRLTQEQAELQKQAAQYLHPAGDLD